MSTGGLLISWRPKYISRENHGLNSIVAIPTVMLKRWKHAIVFQIKYTQYVPCMPFLEIVCSRWDLNLVTPALGCAPAVALAAIVW
jgi:hypothetical protein